MRACLHAIDASDVSFAWDTTGGDARPLKPRLTATIATFLRMDSPPFA